MAFFVYKMFRKMRIILVYTNVIVGHGIVRRVNPFRTAIAGGHSKQDQILFVKKVYTWVFVCTVGPI